MHSHRHRLLLFRRIIIAACCYWSAASTASADEVSLIAQNSQWRYHATAESPPEPWNRADFDDSKWTKGRSGFGYGADDDATELPMRNQFTSMFVRNEFEIDDPTTVQSLMLYIRYDDGFIAYVNGKQVASSCVAKTDNETTVKSHPAGGFELFEIPAEELLRKGENVVAIEGHNAGIDDDNFSLFPILAAVVESEKQFTQADYLADLDEFEKRLLDQSSYLTRRGFDYESALNKFRESLTDETDPFEFTIGLRKLVMQIGDCHSGVYSKVPPPMYGSLPCRFADTAKGLAALKIYSDEPLDAACPYIAALDGIAMDQWLDAAKEYVAFGSPQFRRRRALSEFEMFTLLRESLDVPPSPIVTISLMSADGSTTKEKRARLTAQASSLASIRLGQSRMLEHNIGYIRIPQMDGRLVEPTVDRIKSFRNTDGIIIDVRDNGGGRYLIMSAIYPFFCPADAKSYVTNIAAYRLSENFSKNHIAYRPTYRADWSGWNDEEREAIRKAAATFKPEWTPPKEKFSEWHYMLLNRNRTGRKSLLGKLFGSGAPKDYYFYDKPVVVLSNAGSFSATDGFLSAFAALPQVMIVGEPSGGGSGATRRIVLPKTETMVALSSMASFQADGKTFDGNGVAVDVEAKPTLEDFVDGKDSVLRRGIEVILQKQKEAEKSR